MLCHFMLAFVVMLLILVVVDTPRQQHSCPGLTPFSAVLARSQDMSLSGSVWYYVRLWFSGFSHLGPSVSLLYCYSPML